MTGDKMKFAWTVRMLRNMLEELPDDMLVVLNKIYPCRASLETLLVLKTTKDRKETYAEEAKPKKLVLSISGG